jgi:hypothetical protein
MRWSSCPNGGRHADDPRALLATIVLLAVTLVGSAEELPPGQGVFVGIGLSGVGSRAANFSAAALLELEALGLLERTS